MEIYAYVRKILYISLSRLFKFETFHSFIIYKLPSISEKKISLLFDTINWNYNILISKKKKKKDLLRVFYRNRLTNISIKLSFKYYRIITSIFVLLKKWVRERDENFEILHYKIFVTGGCIRINIFVTPEFIKLLQTMHLYYLKFILMNLLFEMQP